MATLTCDGRLRYRAGTATADRRLRGRTIPVRAATIDPLPTVVVTVGMNTPLGLLQPMKMFDFVGEGV